MVRIKPAAFLCLGALLFAFASSVRAPYRPYRERLPEGTVDWDEGWIQVRASVPIPSGVPAAQARVDAHRAALLKAQASALRLALRLPVNTEKRLSAYEALRVRVKGTVAGGRILNEKLAEGWLTLSLEVPLNGVHGIVSRVSEVTLPQSRVPASYSVPPGPFPYSTALRARLALASPEEPGTVGGESWTGVVVDGIEAGVRPALQPRIIGPDGVEIYGLRTVAPEVAKTRALARYVTLGSAEPARGVDVPVLSRGTGGLPLALIAPPGFLFAQARPSRRPRGGARPYFLTAKKASGPLRADLLVTRETARKLKDMDEKTGLLSRGKVVVVVRADVGGVESLLKPPKPTPWNRLALFAPRPHP